MHTKVKSAHIQYFKRIKCFYSGNRSMDVRFRLFVCVCVCVCVCVHACVHVCMCVQCVGGAQVCACVHACLVYNK